MTTTQTNDHILWYRQPAQRWVEALPIGNGRLGAMVFGGVDTERLQLNDDTLWSGGPREWDNPKARSVLVLAQVRRLIAEGNYFAADILCKEMQGPYNESYQPLADLLIHFGMPGTTTNYTRELNLHSAIATTHYCRGGVEYTREAFASAPDQVIVVRLTARRPGQLCFRVALNSLQHSTTSTENSTTLVLRGKCPTYVAPHYYFEVDIFWQHGALSRATIRASQAGCCCVRANQPIRLDDPISPMKQRDATLTCFAAEPGGIYHIIPAFGNGHD